MPTPLKPPPPFDVKVPSLDEDEDDRDGLDDDAAGTVSFEETDSRPDDDDRPTDPTLAIDLPPDIGTGEDDEEHELPLDTDFAPDDEAPGSPDGDEFGPSDPLEPDFGSAVEGDGRTDDGDGLEHDAFSLERHELPTLEDDEGPDLDDRFSTRLEIADEAALATSARRLSVEFVVPEREHCSALAVARGVVLTGSSDLFWLDSGRSGVVRLALDGTRVSSLALVGEQQTTALCVTAFGRLLRRSRSGADVEKLLDWRRAAEAIGSNAESLELCQLAPERPRSVIGRLTNGRLVKSDDLGTTFHALDARITALAISGTGDPIVVLSRDGSRLSLSADGGADWEHLELATPAREVASGEAPFLAASANVVVLGERERGLAVSGDGGRTFRKVTGASNVTACAAGTREGRPIAFAALYRETEDISLIVEIDPESGEAQIAARVGAPVAADPDQSVEQGRIERLAWDGQRLWAAGAFGLAVLCD